MSENVFERLHEAATQEVGIELSAAEVWLLMEMLSNEISRAGSEFDRWRERLDDFDRVQAREGKAASG